MCTCLYLLIQAVENLAVVLVTLLFAVVVPDTFLAVVFWTRARHLLVLKYPHESMFLVSFSGKEEDLTCCSDLSFKSSSSYCCLYALPLALKVFKYVLSESACKFGEKVSSTASGARLIQ